MEFNKEEAIRAKEIAEKMMQNEDYQGAQNIALWAKNLFPELDNISQMLAVCNVHCSAQNKLSENEMDFYKILQIERVANEASIRNQYKNFALLTHPDKNKFPGAEAAFKLIGEAYDVLSDKEKRWSYDIMRQNSHNESASANSMDGKNEEKGPFSNENFNFGSTEQKTEDCLDSEFNDFDSQKDKEHFNVNQIWACYDSTDAMPRIYAFVRNVFLSPRFSLHISWLEANPEEKWEVDWVKKGLPVACGKFKQGETVLTSNHFMFSHQVDLKNISSQHSYMIFPQKGEIWALFKGWNIGWKFDLENHKKFKYEIVEILSDFGNGTGIKVGFLEKVEGFISLFEPITQEGIVAVLIPANELLRFSHRIPSFKMTGSERKGVPKGCFELDPAALFINPNDLQNLGEEGL